MRPAPSAVAFTQPASLARVQAMSDKVDHHREGTNEALVVKYQRGDRTALSILVRRHARAIYSTAFYIVGDVDLASRLTLEVFRSAMEQAGSFHIEMQFRTWIFGFLHQRMMALLDGSAELPRNTDGANTSGEPGSSNAIARLGRSQLLNRRVTDCVSALPLQAREAISLKLVGQLTIPELATVTQSSDDTVRDLLRQALERIRDAISDTEDYARALR